MSEPLVVVEDLRKSFLHMGRELHVLRGINLTINQGEVVAIVGASGAGKSTLLHCIGTLDLPTSGRIRLGRDELVSLSSSKLAAIRNRMIGFVFQADQPGSFGPGLREVTSRNIATELDAYADWKINGNFSVSFIAAVANPQAAVAQGYGRTKNFTYGMIYVTYSY